MELITNILQADTHLDNRAYGERQGVGHGWIATGRARRTLRKGTAATIALKGWRARTPFDGESCDAPGASARSPPDGDRGTPDIFDG